MKVNIICKLVNKPVSADSARALKNSGYGHWKGQQNLN